MSTIGRNSGNKLKTSLETDGRSSIKSKSSTKQSETSGKKEKPASIDTRDKTTISEEAKEKGGKGEKEADTSGIVKEIKNVSKEAASTGIMVRTDTDEKIKSEIKSDSRAGKIFDKMNESQKREFIDIARKSYKHGRDDTPVSNKPDYLQVLAGSKITQKDKLEKSTNEVTDTLKKGKSVPVSINLNKDGKGSEASNKMLIENIERNEVTLRAPNSNEKRESNGKKKLGDRSRGGKVVKMNREEFHRRLMGYHAQRESSLKKLRDNWIK